MLVIVFVLSAQSGKPESLLPLGMIVWLASELMFFAALFAAYFALSARGAAWPPVDVELDTWRAAVFTLVLVVSSYTMHRSVHASDAAGTRLWLLVTLALGAVFL